MGSLETPGGYISIIASRWSSRAKLLGGCCRRIVFFLFVCLFFCLVYFRKVLVCVVLIFVFPFFPRFFFVRALLLLFSLPGRRLPS